MTNTEPIFVHVKAGLPIRKPNMALRKAEPYVKVRATFVYANNYTKPPVFIDEPTDLSEYIGDIYANEFDILVNGHRYQTLSDS